MLETGKALSSPISLPLAVLLAFRRSTLPISSGFHALRCGRAPDIVRLSLTRCLAPLQSYSGHESAAR